MLDSDAMGYDDVLAGRHICGARVLVLEHALDLEPTNACTRGRTTISIFVSCVCKDQTGTRSLRPPWPPAIQVVRVVMLLLYAADVLLY